MTTYYTGTRVRVTAQYTALGVATNPTTPTFKVFAPGSGVTSSTPTTTGTTGGYYKDITLNAPGMWTVQAVGTGAVVAASEPLTLEVVDVL